MSDLLLLGGVALCLLSVIVAIVQLLRTQPPRAAAILLVLGIAAVFGAAYLSPDPFGAAQIQQAWTRLTGGDATTP